MSKIPGLKVYQPVVCISDSYRFRPAVCDLHDDEDPVQSGLSFTPSKMLKMAAEGIPISTQTAGATFDDGYRTLDFEPLLEHQRGIDMADLWEREQDAKRKIKKAFKKAQQTTQTE